MIFSCHFPWRREDGRMKIVNRPEIHVPQTNHVMDNMGVTVYKFALGLFGLQIDFIGLLQRIDYCGPSIGCMQPLVLKKKPIKASFPKKEAHQGFFSRFYGLLRGKGGREVGRGDRKNSKKLGLALFALWNTCVITYICVGAVGMLVAAAIICLTFIYVFANLRFGPD